VHPERRGQVPSSPAASRRSPRTRASNLSAEDVPSPPEDAPLPSTPVSAAAGSQWQRVGSNGKPIPANSAARSRNQNGHTPKRTINPLKLVSPQGHATRSLSGTLTAIPHMVDDVEDEESDGSRATKAIRTKPPAHPSNGQ